MGDCEFSKEEIERGRLLFAGPADFMLGVVAMDGLPPQGPSEIAFAGRSNVGKSSLLNALTGRKNLARASTTPGRTQEINFFDLGGALRLVDLPGFGYARATRSDARRWARLTRDYLRGRSTLRRVFLLIDSRHGAKEIDGEVMDDLDKAAVNYQLVLTKADKMKPSELERVRNAVQALIARRAAAHPQIITTSSQTGEGIDDLRADIARLAPFTNR